MSSMHQTDSGLLQLPDPCLLSVLQCYADDPRSLFSAARAHSRLRQAAVLTVSSIKAVVTEEQDVQNVLLYLDNHGPYVSSIDLAGMEGTANSLKLLPVSRLQKLDSLSVCRFRLYLDGHGFLGLTGAAVTKLRVHGYALSNGEPQLAPTLLLLPELQQLSLTWNKYIWGCAEPYCRLPASIQQLQKLTRLELGGFDWKNSDNQRLLQGLTRLQDLRLGCRAGDVILASTLSGMQHLTVLKVEDAQGTAAPLPNRMVRVSLPTTHPRFAPDALAGMTQLQRLELIGNSIIGSSGEAQLLQQLQHMQQLTHLDLRSSLRCLYTSPPAGATAALTASDKLQYLDISCCSLPGVWQHLFPVGRQLLHLKALIMRNTSHNNVGAPALDGDRLVSCCPRLQSVKLGWVQHSVELFAPLTWLSSLHELSLRPWAGSPSGLELVCKLTQLRRLDLLGSVEDEQLVLLQLTQLQQLTHLSYKSQQDLRTFCEAPGAVPVWQQLQQHLKSNDVQVAQQAPVGVAK